VKEEGDREIVQRERKGESDSSTKGTSRVRLPYKEALQSSGGPYQRKARRGEKARRALLAALARKVGGGDYLVVFRPEGGEVITQGGGNSPICRSEESLNFSEFYKKQRKGKIEEERLKTQLITFAEEIEDHSPRARPSGGSVSN